MKKLFIAVCGLAVVATSLEGRQAVQVESGLPPYQKVSGVSCGRPTVVTHMMNPLMT